MLINIDNLEFRCSPRNDDLFVITARNPHSKNNEEGKRWGLIEDCTYSKPALTKLKDYLDGFLYNFKEEKSSDIIFKFVEEDQGYFELYINKTQVREHSWLELRRLKFDTFWFYPIYYNTYSKSDLSNLRDYLIEFLKN